MLKWLTYILTFTVIISCTEEQKKSNLNNHSLNSAGFTITYTDNVYNKKYGSCLNNVDCAEVNIIYPQLTGESEVLKLINNSLLSQLLKDNDEDIPYNSFDEIADSLFSQYENLQKEFSDYKTAWSIEKNMSVSGVVNNFITFKNEIIIYTGGANNYYNVVLTVFDLETGEQQSLRNFINPEKINELLKIGEKRFKIIKEIPEDTTLKGTGFWFNGDAFYLPENFAVTDSGFVFFYNLYEIAPRSEGITELFISKDKLNSILKSKSIYH